MTARARRGVIERQGLCRGLIGVTAPPDHRARLQGQRLDRQNPIQNFEQKSLAASLDIVDVAQFDAELARHERQRHKSDGRHHEHDQCQLPGIDQEHRQKDDDAGEIQKRVEQPARKEVADVIRLLQFVGGNTRRIRMEVVDGQFQQMIDRCERDCAVELSCDEREQIVAQIVETAVEQDQDHNAGSNRVQGRESLVRHDLVDEQLKKDRYRQRDQIHRERRDNDVAHQ